MQAALGECNRLSCSLRNNIYKGVVRQGDSVHPLATGIGNTSVTATRDWIMQNVLQASDDFSRDLATNMTEIARLVLYPSIPSRSRSR